MQIKTIKKVIVKKLEEWLTTIEDVKLRDEVRKNLLVSGGAITSLLQNLPVNDYDIYIQNMDVLIKLANYYCSGKVLDGRLRGRYLENDKSDLYQELFGFNDNSELTVRVRTLKENQVKLNIPSVGMKVEPKLDAEGNPLKYQVAFLSQNAISLTDDIQIVLRFSGSVEEIHKTFDFIHATNYYTFSEGLITNVAALESIITKCLRYQGSLYPLTSIIRMKKFIARGWTINAGEMLKAMFQISELDLKDPDVLEEQLIGVDVAYFAVLIEVLRGVNPETITASYLATIIDKVFNEYEDTDEPQ